MNCLVTGGAGFVGTSLLSFLAKEKWVEEIFILDKISYSSNHEILSRIENIDKAQLVRGDIREKDIVKQLVDKVDIIIHLAGETHVDHSIETPEKFYDVNVKGTLNLLEATNRYPVKQFVHVSTDEVWGQIAYPHLFLETDSYQPRNPYAASKAAADHFVRAWGNTYGLNYKIVHFTNLYGAYQYPDKLIPQTIVCSLLGLPITIHGNGQQVRSWLHVNDAVNGLMTVVDKGQAGRSYIVGSREEYSVLQVNELIQKELCLKERPPVQHVSDRLSQDSRYAVTYDRIYNELGWEPKYNFLNGLTDVVNWYSSHRDWWRNKCNHLNIIRK